MSAFLFGHLSERREESKGGLLVGSLAGARAAGLHATRADEGGGQPDDGDRADPVKRWVDVVAALVPAEILALHALAMTLGTTTTGAGDDATTVISRPGDMRLIFWGLVVLAPLLYLVGVLLKALKGPATGGSLVGRVLGWRHVVRALIASAAFVSWTMLQPSTAFDALGVELSGLLRASIAAVVAILISVVTAVLAAVSDKQPSQG